MVTADPTKKNPHQPWRKMRIRGRLRRRRLALPCLYHPAAMARARCLRRVPLRRVGTCLDAADDRRNSRRGPATVPGRPARSHQSSSWWPWPAPFWFCGQVVYSYETRRASRSTLDEGAVRPGINRRPRSMWATIQITAEDAILFLLVRVMCVSVRA